MMNEAFWLREVGALRTPIMDMIGLSEVIVLGKFGPINPTYRDYAEEILKATRRLIDRISQDLAEHKVKTRSNTELQSERRDRVELIYMLSEIRSPLNLVIGFPEIMMRELLGEINCEYRACAGDIYAIGVSLLETITNLSILAQLEARQTALDETTVDVENLIQETLRQALPGLAQRQKRPDWVPSAIKLPKVHCDRSRLRDMLFKMLSTAAKFDEPGRKIEIGTDLSQGLTIVIQDSGWGLLMDTLQLFLTKALMEYQGGQFSIASRPNGGVTVRLTFPPERLIQGGE